jgi:hypothetical protein
MAHSAKGKILVAMSSADYIRTSDNKEHATGFFLKELGRPLIKLLEAGYNVEVSFFNFTPREQLASCHHLRAALTIRWKLGRKTVFIVDVDQVLARSSSGSKTLFGIGIHASAGPKVEVHASPSAA